MACYLVALWKLSLLEKQQVWVAAASDMFSLAWEMAAMLALYQGLGDPSSRAFESQNDMSWCKIVFPFLVAARFILKGWSYWL